MSRVLVVAFCLLAAPCQTWAVDYCPLYLMGQWNGMYYYYCTYTNSSGQCVPGYAGDTRIHTLSSYCPAACVDKIQVLGGGDDKKQKRVKLPNKANQVFGPVKRGHPDIPGSTNDSTDIHGEFRALDFKVAPATGNAKRKIRADNYIRIRRRGNPSMQTGWHVIRLLRFRVSDSEGDIGIGQECSIPFDDPSVVVLPNDKEHLEEFDNADARYAVTIWVHSPEPDGGVASLPAEEAERVPFPYYVIMHQAWEKP